MDYYIPYSVMTADLSVWEVSNIWLKNSVACDCLQTWRCIFSFCAQPGTLICSLRWKPVLLCSQQDLYKTPDMWYFSSIMVAIVWRIFYLLFYSFLSLMPNLYLPVVLLTVIWNNRWSSPNVLCPQLSIMYRLVTYCDKQYSSFLSG